MTRHGTLLGFDHIREFTTDPDRRGQDGFLTLKSQLHIGGNSLWVEPIGSWSPVDQFAHIQDWNRDNDEAYLQNLAPQPQPVISAPHVNDGRPALMIGFLALLVGAAICASD